MDALYRTLAADLRSAILTGAFPPGSALPSEHALQRQRQVSRHTVREALRMLHAEGLIDRRRGRGSFVRGARPDAPFTQTIGGLPELLQYARNARLEVTAYSAEATPGAEGARLGLSAAARWGKLSGLRRAGPAGAAIALTRIYVLAALLPTRAAIAAWPGALNELIATQTGVASVRIEQSIAAVALRPAEARRLAAPAASPALRTIRRYHDASGRLFQASISLHPGDRFAYSMDLARQEK